MTNTKPVAVTLDQEVGRREELSDQHYTGIQFFEDMGAAIFGKCKGENIAATLIQYRVGGSVWSAQDTIINNTTFQAAPYDRTKIEDNDFISHRVDPIYRCDDFTITKEHDRVIWQADDRQMIARPPFWDIKGEHLGVDVDVTMEQFGDADWILGPWDDLPKTGRAGRDVVAKASGRITARGKVYELEEHSVAVHEHVVLGESWVAQARSPIQYFYHVFRSEELQLMVLFRPDSGLVYGRVVVPEGKEIRYSGANITIEEQDYWFDPRTAIRPPVRFRVQLDSAEGTVELFLTAYSRSLYVHAISQGTRTNYAMLVHSIGKFVGPDGKAILITDREEDLSYIEWGITSPLGSGAPSLRP